VFDTEGLAGHSGADDVRIVPVADRGEGRGSVDPGRDQYVAVVAHSPDRVFGHVATQSPKRIRILVDHRHRVPQVDQPVRKGGPHTTAAHDHDVHLAPHSVEIALPGLPWSRAPARSHCGTHTRDAWRRSPKLRRLARGSSNTRGGREVGNGWWLRTRGSPEGRSEHPRMARWPVWAPNSR